MNVYNIFLRRPRATGAVPTAWQTVTPSGTATVATAINRLLGMNVILNPPADDTQPVNVPTNVPDTAQMEIQLVGGGGSGSWVTWNADSPSTPGFFFLTGAAPTADPSGTNVTPVYVKRNGAKYEAVVTAVKPLGDVPLVGGQVAAIALNVARKYDVSFGSGLDANNLYVLAPSATARCIQYTPLGSNTGPIGSGPFLYTRTTLAGCKALMRDGQGDWTLFPSGTMLSLKATPIIWGDFGAIGGASSAFPTLYGTYDVADSTNFSKFNTLPSKLDVTDLTYPTTMFFTGGTSKGNIVFCNLQLYSPNPWNQGKLINIIGDHDHILLQKCITDGGTGIDFQGDASTPGTDFTTVPVDLLLTNFVINQCGFGYGATFNSTFCANFYFEMARGVRIYNSIIHHGGWSRAGDRGVQRAWSPGPTRSITGLTQAGGIATALTANTTGLVDGSWVVIAGTSPGSYSFVTQIFNTVAATSFQYYVDPSIGATATGTITWQTAAAGTWDPIKGQSPNVFNHNVYISQDTDDVKMYDTVLAWDCANPKWTGGNARLENVVEIRDPMGFLTDSNGNDAGGTTWPTNANVVFLNHLQVNSADMTTDLGRGWACGLNAIGAGSNYTNGFVMNQDNTNVGSRLGVRGNANSRPIQAFLTLAHTIVANWGTQNDAGETNTTKSFKYCITDDAVALTGATNQKRTSTSAAFQAKVTAALAKNVYTTFRTETPELSGVVVGGTDLETEMNVLDAMLYSPTTQWAVKLQQHFRGKIGR